MKLMLALSLSAVFVMALACCAAAQSSSDAAQTVASLTSQLHDVQDQEAELKIRLDQLDHDLKPENLERYFSGVGSTRPEELRNARRNQLQLEKNRVVAQLDRLATNRAGLESAISNAQAQAYQQSAQGQAKLSRENRGSPWVTLARALTVLVVILLVVGTLVLTLLMRKRQRPI